MEKKYKVRLLLSYDGYDYGGWQRQTAGKPTIQGTVEMALSRIFSEDIRICGSGRTDAGVHAVEQTAHFWTSKEPARFNLMRSLNALTPDSIVLKRAWLAPNEFHALTSAQQKTYKYLIFQSPTPSALKARYTHWVRQPLDLGLLNQMAQYLVKKQDFSSFQTSGTDVKTTVREIFKAHWKARKDHLIEFEIQGDGFLKQMVRTIVGTQLHLLAKGSTPAEFEKIILSCDRRVAKESAPAQGLYLYRVSYPSELDNRCRKI